MFQLFFPNLNMQAFENTRADMQKEILVDFFKKLMKPCKEIVLTQDLRDSRSRSNNVSYLCSFITYIFWSSSSDFREILSLEPRAIMREH